MQPTQAPLSLLDLLTSWQRQRRQRACAAAIGCLVFGVALAFIAGALWQFVASVAVIVASLGVLVAVLLGAFDHERRAVARARAGLRRLDETALVERWQSMYAAFVRDRSLASAAFLRAIELERPGAGIGMVVGGAPPDADPPRAA